ncbi:hypothetical protein [Microbulbifer sp. YPW1]|uniref:hypothetical protein n=1 Tax=Microbulbifer sp. YPW1 TaxID=2745199 RepID=UPI0015981311|nr:hypothetical protein [Microbulbifer sp. YPW1]QKX15815.1 hypothetical protein HUW35_01690 [Microbulbifer sp. YPW1]
MLDFIKYNPFELREQNGLCIPKGPNFTRARKYTYDLLGSKLSFKAPKQFYLFRPGSEQYTPRWFEYDLESLKPGNDPTQTWWHSLLFSRKYAFYGSWFVGEKADASFAILAMAPEVPPENLNFLHPRAFESAISGYLTAEYGYDEWGKGVARWRAPLKWKAIDDLPVPAALLHVENTIDMHRTIYFLFPITKDRIISLSFSYHLHASGSFEEKESIVSSKPVLDLINNIINSVELKPSPELEKELAELRKSCPDLNVSKNFPPLKWPATVDETGLNIVEMNEKQRKALVG